MLDIEQKTVALHTLGCRLNFSETGEIAQGFKNRGYEVVDFGKQADVTFINTCTVTDGADSTCRNLIRRAHKTSPEGKIVVAGCYAQMEADKIKSMQGVDLILGNSEKYKVFDYLDEEDEQVIRIDKTHEFNEASTTPADGHTRAFLKIQDGCNYICSFCIIPFARGRSRALPVEQAVLKAKEIVSNGFKEIILTGVNIGEYEINTGERLTDLLKALTEIDGLERIRLSSVEPNTITDELIELWKSSNKFLPHFHIPMQSGDNDVLFSMRRKYSVAEYCQIIDKVNTAFPEAGIGADIIAGYPGETDEQFNNTYELLKELPITHFHVFPYSMRKNTTAARLPDHIQHEVKKARVKKLNDLGDKKLLEFKKNQIGKTVKVLFEKRINGGRFEGHTPNFLKVSVESESNLRNSILDVKIVSLEGDLLIGKLSQ